MDSVNADFDTIPNGERIFISVEDYDVAAQPLLPSADVGFTTVTRELVTNDEKNETAALDSTKDFMRVLNELLMHEIRMLRGEGAEEEATFLLDTLQNDDGITKNSSALRVKFLTVRFNLQLRTTRSIENATTIRYVYYHRRNNTIVVCDDRKCAHIFSSCTVELQRANVPLHARLNKLIWSNFADTFAGFEWNKPCIHIYSETLHHYTTARTEQAVIDAVFCDATNKLYVAERQQLSLWLFGADQQSIERLCTIQNLSYLDWTLNMANESFYGNAQYRFFIENSASRSQRAYVITERWILSARVCMNYAQDYLRHAQDDESWISLSSVIWLDQPRWLVCGYVDGTIRVFDRSLNLVMTLLGNDSRIVSLALYPGTNSTLLALTEDNNMVAWCMKQRCVVDRTWLSHPSSGSSIVVANNSSVESGAFIFNGKNLYFYCCDDTFQHILSLGGGLVVKLANCSLPAARGDRICCLCDDDMVRIVDPRDGNLVTSALLYDRPVDVAVAPSGDIYVATTCGNLVRIDVSSNNMRNPCNVLAEWQISVLVKDESGDGESNRNSSVTMQTDLLLEVTKVIVYRLEAFKHSRNHHHQTSKVTQNKFSFQNNDEDFGANADQLDFVDWNESSANKNNSASASSEKFVLVIGTRNGYLAVVDPKRGVPLNVVRGHENCAVIDLVCSDYYAAAPRVVSAGERDNLIRVWTCNSYGSLWPTLEMLYSLYSQVAARHICLIQNIIMVCYCSTSNVETANEPQQHSLVVFDLDSRERFDHKQDVEHAVAVTALTGNKTLLVFVSCAADGTLRVWNEQNVLLRIIELCGNIDCIASVGTSADLCISMRNSLYLLKQKQYLPQRYWGRLAFVPNSNNSQKVGDENAVAATSSAIPIDENVLRQLDEFDRDRLLQTRLAPGDIPTTLDELSEFEIQQSLLTKVRVKDNLNKVKVNDDVIERVFDIDSVAEQSQHSPPPTDTLAYKQPQTIKNKTGKTHHRHPHRSHHHQHNKHGQLVSFNQKSSRHPGTPRTTTQTHAAHAHASDNNQAHLPPSIGRNSPKQLSPRLQQWIAHDKKAGNAAVEAASSYLFNVINDCLKNEALRTPHTSRTDRAAFIRYARRNNNDLLSLLGPEAGRRPSQHLSAEAGDAIWRLKHGVSPATRERLVPDRTLDAKLDENVLVDEEHGFFPPEQQRQLLRPANVADAGGVHFLTMVPNSELINRLWLHTDLLSLIYMRIARRQLLPLRTRNLHIDTRLLQYALKGGSARRHAQMFPSPYKPFHQAMRKLLHDAADSQLALALKPSKSENNLADMMRTEAQKKKATEKQEEAERLSKQQAVEDEQNADGKEAAGGDDAERGVSDGDVMEGMVQLKLLNIFKNVKTNQQHQLTQKELDEKAAYEALKIVGLDEDKFARLEREMNQVYSAASGHMGAATKRAHDAALERQRVATAAVIKDEEPAKLVVKPVDENELVRLSEILERTARRVAEGEALAKTALADMALPEDEEEDEALRRRSAKATARKSIKPASNASSPKQPELLKPGPPQPWTPTKQSVAGGKKSAVGQLALRQVADRQGNLTWQLIDISNEPLTDVGSAAVVTDGRKSLTVVDDAASRSQIDSLSPDLHVSKHKRKRMRAQKMQFQIIARKSAEEEARISNRQEFLAQQRAAFTTPDGGETEVGAGLLQYMKNIMKSSKTGAPPSSGSSAFGQFGDTSARTASLELERVLKMSSQRLRVIGQTGKPALEPQPTKRQLLKTLLQVESVIEAPGSDVSLQPPLTSASSTNLQYAKKEHQAGFTSSSAAAGSSSNTTLSSLPQPERPRMRSATPTKSVAARVVEQLIEEDEEGKSESVIEQTSSLIAAAAAGEEESAVDQRETESLSQTLVVASSLSVRSSPNMHNVATLVVETEISASANEVLNHVSPTENQQDTVSAIILQDPTREDLEANIDIGTQSSLSLAAGLHPQSATFVADNSPSSMFFSPLSEMTSEELLYSMPNNRRLPPEPEVRELSVEEKEQEEYNLLNRQLQGLVHKTFLTKSWFAALELISCSTDAEQTKLEIEKLTIDQFVERLANNFEQMSCSLRCDAIDAMLNIDDELESGIPEHLTAIFCQTLFDSLARIGLKRNKAADTPPIGAEKSMYAFKVQDIDTEIFIASALKGLHVFEDSPRPEYVTELMLNYMCGSDKLRQLAYGLLCLEGLNDPELMLATELDDWRTRATAAMAKAAAAASPALSTGTKNQPTIQKPTSIKNMRHVLRHKTVLFLNKWTSRYRYVKGKNEQTPFDVINFFCRIKEAEARQRERFPLAAFQPTKFGNETDEEAKNEFGEEDENAEDNSNAISRVGELFLRYLYPVMKTTLRFGKQYPLKHVDTRILPDRPEVVMFKKYFYQTDSFICSGIKTGDA